MHSTIIAIDPGSLGFITILRNGKPEFISIYNTDYYELAAHFRRFATDTTAYPDPIVVMEEVHAIFGSSAKSTFSFGRVNGFLLGLIVANGLPYHLVPPKEWQRVVWNATDKVYKTPKPGSKTRQIDTKHTSLNCARRLYPTVDLRRTPQCKKEDDNLVDSLLIATYASRTNI